MVNRRTGCAGPRRTRQRRFSRPDARVVAAEELAVMGIESKPNAFPVDLVADKPVGQITGHLPAVFDPRLHTATGQVACCATAWLTEPSRSRVNLPRPWEPTTTIRA